MRLAVAHWLMRRRFWAWLPGDVQNWAVHEHLMQFPSYRRLVEESR